MNQPLDEKSKQTLRDILVILYGDDSAGEVLVRLVSRLERFQAATKRRFQRKDELFNERDIVVITYGDLLKQHGEAPLITLHRFAREYLADVVNTIHILPFYPYSSDDGFSVIDYTSVNPALGSWEQIEQFQADSIRLMFDAVINHISAKSAWFEAFKAGDSRYRDYFITVDPAADLSEVVRPRALPLLTPVETSRGQEHVWTTFSEDQIDLNYANPDTLLDIVDVLLEYVERGADIIRLDAIAYLWKEPGTTCIHLPQTHAAVRLIRAIFDIVAPSVLIITETNVPYQDNISYFGDGTDEAHLVYNFSLPPLTAHAILTGSAQYLTHWAAGLHSPSAQTTFFNFTASHDGVGVQPAAGILDEAELSILLERTEAGGGAISSKQNADGTTSPYELNITYFDLLNGQSGDPQSIQVRRFLLSQAIMLALTGVPGIYMHSLLGSQNFSEWVRVTGRKRTINREKLDIRQVELQLNDPLSLRYQVFTGYKNLLKARMQEQAFHPTGQQTVLELGESIFALVRRSPGGEELVLTLHNVSAGSITCEIAEADLHAGAGQWIDLLSNTRHPTDSGSLRITLAPYQAVWLKPA